jgi:cytosine/adenosine deaminase-related metal-dependent hydrolase
MIRLGAAWVVPVDQRPIRDGWVAVDGDRIVAVGQGDSPEAMALGPVRDLGQVALMPGLVNAHVHLELSWLRDRVPPAADFTTWITGLFAARGGAVERLDDPGVTSAALAGAREAREFGTVAVGDISNSLAAVDAIVASGMHGLVFHELLGFKETTGALVERSRTVRAEAAARSPRVRISVAPHAPYSVSRELFQAIREEVTSSAEPITSVHVGESPEEVELLASGNGPWAQLLRRIGAWREGWVAPGLGPVEYLDELGVIDARTLIVHGVQLGEHSLARLHERGATLVTCPRSNQWVGVGAPPIERFYLSGVPVAIGTDSLASVSDLNLFAEMKEMRWLAPGVPARRIIESATLVGARALGLDHRFGTLSTGKHSEMVAVSLPDDLEDVEEYLVSGVSAAAVSWAPSH